MLSDLLCDISTVDLDLHDVGLLLLELEQLRLGVAQHSDHRAVLGDLKYTMISRCEEFSFGVGLGI